MVATIDTPGLWMAVALFVLGMVALDLGVFRREMREVNVREGLVWIAVLNLTFA
jgi:hypothetical protein